jgi:CopG family nickel-responsive transcriptional regulator
VEAEWAETSKETVGVICLVYNHERRELASRLMDLQHHHYLSVISALHIHLDHHNCLEVLIVKGKGTQIKVMADKLISTKGVKYGSLSPATTGKKIV